MWRWSRQSGAPCMSRCWSLRAARPHRRGRHWPAPPPSPLRWSGSCRTRVRGGFPLLVLLRCECACVTSSPSHAHAQIWQPSGNGSSLPLFSLSPCVVPVTAPPSLGNTISCPAWRARGGRVCLFLCEAGCMCCVRNFSVLCLPAFTFCVHDCVSCVCPKHVSVRPSRSAAASFA